MDIDLRTAVAGSEVTFRCGGTAVLAEVKKSDRAGLPSVFWIRLFDYEPSTTMYYTQCGLITGQGRAPLDIVAIKPPALTPEQTLYRIADIVRCARLYRPGTSDPAYLSERFGAAIKEIDTLTRSIEL